MKLSRVERSFFAEGYKRIIAVDEVWMGCLAGPVVVCAVVLTKDIPLIRNIRDSKLMTAPQRETCADIIKKLKLKYKISYCYPKTIDKINIYQASRKAMRRAVTAIQLYSYTAIVLVDGPHKIPNLKLPQQAIVHGDRKVFAIACASILAKVYRDKMMRNYAQKYPRYGFEKHKGYGTKLHYAMLAKYGPCELHRKSFRIVTS